MSLNHIIIRIISFISFYNFIFEIYNGDALWETFLIFLL